MWSDAVVNRVYERLMVCVLIVVGIIACGAMGGDDELTCPEVTRTVLDCGVEVVVYARDDLVGETQVWVRLHHGSMHELDHERGASVLASRAAVLGVGGVSGDRISDLLGTEPDHGVIGERVRVGLGHIEFPFEVGEPGLGSDLGSDWAKMRDAMRVGRALVDGYVPSDEAIDRARDEVLGEVYRIDEEEVDRSLMRRWIPELVGGSGYGKLPIPSRDVVAGISGDAVRGSVERLWSADRASVLVVGDVDADEVIGLAREVFDGCDGEGRGHHKDPFPIVFEEGLGGRVVTLGDERVGLSRIGLVWFGQTHEPRWDDAGVQDLLVMALVGESMRHRVSLMLGAELSNVEQVRVDAGDLLGRARYGQIVAVFDHGSGEVAEQDWGRVIRAMERERVRLVRDGVSESEIERAREWLTQQWGYEVDQWKGSRTDELARSLSWMIMMDRPLVELEDWVDWARGMLDGVGRDEIHDVIRAMFSGEPAVLVLLDTEDAADEADIRSALISARADELPALTEGWIDELSGPILERTGGRVGPRGSRDDFSGEVDEISLHPASGVVSAKLGNGIVIHHREMIDPESPGRVVFSVRVGFDSIESAEMSGAGNVVVEAMKRGSIRSRTEREMRGILVEHDLELDFELGAWGMQIGVTAPIESYDRAVEFVYALLADLRIEGSLIDEIATEIHAEARTIGAPIDGVEAGIGRAFGVRFSERADDDFGELVDARSVREWISDRVHGGAIEIGIAGGIGAQQAIEACAQNFGRIGTVEPFAGDIERETDVIAEGDPFVGVDGEETIWVVGSGKAEGILVGFGACDVDDIESVRTLTVAGMVLDRRLRELARSFGDGVEVYSGAMMLDLVPDRVVMYARVECEADDLDEWGALLEEELERMAYGGVESWEVEEPRERIGEALEGWFASGWFWSGRLSELSERGGDIDSLWSMRDSYSVITARDLESVFGRWYRDGRHFRIEIVDEER